MKTRMLILSVLICCEPAFSQTMKVSGIRDTLSEEHLKKIINKEFNAVINSSGKTTIGNYASADVKNGHLVFNATKNFKQGSMLSLNASGGITDGFFAIFNQTKVNSNVGVNLKFNVRLNSSSISFLTGEIDKLFTNFKIADAEHVLRKIIYKHDSILLQKKLNLLDSEIRSLSEYLSGPNLSPEQRVNPEYQLAIKNVQKDSVQFKLQTLPTAREIEEEAISRKKKKRNEAISNFAYTGIFFHWLSFGAGFQNNNFYQFKPQFSTLDSQVVKQNYVIWKGVAEYNFYKWNQYADPTFYFLIGASASIDDNFSDLSKVEMNDTYVYGDSANQRTKNKKFYAYEGAYRTKLLSVTFYMHFYRFFLKNNAAIHIYPETVFEQQKQPLYNTGLGLLYSFTDASDHSAKLHAELYFQLSDLSNTTNSSSSLWKRNELGLRLSVPILFFNH